MEGEVLTFTPAAKIQTTSDVNMFLTRHRLLHESENVPRIPLSISHCWMNTYLERKKLELNDFGYNESAEVFTCLIYLTVGNDQGTRNRSHRRSSSDRSNPSRRIQNKTQSRSKSFHTNLYAFRYRNPCERKYYETRQQWHRCFKSVVSKET